MDPQIQTKPKSNAKDFFLNLGAFVALYTSIVAILNLLFTAINKAYPQVSAYNYYYASSSSISFPVATLIIFFPLFVFLMGVIQRDYMLEPERKSSVHKWLTYITLFVSGLTLAGDLVSVLYYFLDGQELTAGFLLKVLSVFVIALGVFMYFISDIRGKLTPASRKIWITISTVFVIISIVWGFSVIGSPRTQQLLKYDMQKSNDLQTLNYQVQSYFHRNGSLPGTMSELTSNTSFYGNLVDTQNKTAYEYVLVGQSAKAYQLCAVFNKESTDANKGGYSYAYPADANANFYIHPAGRHCFNLSIPVSMYPQVPVKLPM